MEARYRYSPYLVGWQLHLHQGRVQGRYSLDDLLFIWRSVINESHFGSPLGEKNNKVCYFLLLPVKLLISAVQEVANEHFTNHRTGKVGAV
jgi:hypothetical protein